MADTESTNACPTSPTTDIQPELRETGAPCETCGKPIEVGHVVLCYDDAGEMHADCERPYALDYTREDGEPDPAVLLGSPMRHVALSRLTYTTPTLGDMKDAAAKGRHVASRKTHCANGHPFEGSNLIRDRQRRRKTCHYEQTKRSKLNKRVLAEGIQHG